ncbi:hypothetical protein SAMN05660380_02012 [Xylella fastidiosa]|jgi:cytochrome b|uniref:Uncharacterized protein n=1 Tax=Xylella fastidiosa (strain M23) TaxID=405441 RepID=B2IAG5_XYLF2|nr:hypothetical protein XfasM23_0806 [Xylella fastidiosa M23]SHH04995.1 hypothetical protein SAMN05660380_02012 [Xylella fastidiosa]
MLAAVRGFSDRVWWGVAGPKEARLATYGDVKRCLTVLREYLAGVLSIHECSFCRFSVPYQAEH